MRNSRAMGVFLSIFAIISLSSCGGGASSSIDPNPQARTANVFSVGTDAPLPSITACEITVTGVTIFNGTNDVPVMTQTPQVIDFARLSGLHQLMDLNTVPTGTYSSATVTLANPPMISYIDTSVSPPIIATVPNASLTVSTVKVNFAQSLMLNQNDTVGLRMEFDLRKSIQLDANGNVTGQVNPTFNMQLLAAGASDVSIDDFHAGFVGMGDNGAFTVQGPHGRQWTVQPSNSTVWDDPNIPVSSFTNNTILSISGQLDPVTKDIDASEIEVVSMDGFFLGGLLTYVNPPSPQPATTVNLYVREELPDVVGLEPGDIESLTLDGSEQYRIANIRNPLTTLLFNNTLLAAGQRVDIGGKVTTSNGLDTLTPHRVVLRRQGQAGTWVPGSTQVQSQNAGSFQLNDQWTAGVLLPQPLTVLTTDDTNFINLSGLSGLTGANPIPIRVVGFILVNPEANYQPVFIARSVEQLND